MQKINFNNTRIGILGLGYVGLPLAIEFGKKWQTIGYDVNSQRIKALQSSNDNTLEVSSDDFLESRNLKFTDDLNCIKECNIYIVSVPTPIDHKCEPDLSLIKEATSSLSSILDIGDIVVYESTVYPGLTEEICVPLLEESGLKFNIDFFCGYSPERINPGDRNHKLKDIVKVVSASNDEVLKILDDLYSSIINAGTYLAESIKVAEAAKVIENTQRDLNIALINEFSIIFNKLNIDTDAVLDAAKTKWNFLDFKPGLVGGHCIGVDPYYLTFKSKEIGYTPEIILAGRRLNNEMPNYVANRILDAFDSKKISHNKLSALVLGFTFKENCPDIRNTKIYDLFKSLQSLNIQLDVFDPVANPQEIFDVYGINALFKTPKKRYDAVILAVPHNFFMESGIDYIKNLCKKKHVFVDLKSSFGNGDSDFRL